MQYVVRTCLPLIQRDPIACNSSAVGTKGTRGLLFPHNIFILIEKQNYMIIYFLPLNPQVVKSSVTPEFMLCFQYFKAHIHASCMLDCFPLKNRPASLMWKKVAWFWKGIVALGQFPFLLWSDSEVRTEWLTSDNEWELIVIFKILTMILFMIKLLYWQNSLKAFKTFIKFVSIRIVLSRRISFQTLVFSRMDSSMYLNL